jgi:hypothetical protein
LLRVKVGETAADDEQKHEQVFDGGVIFHFGSLNRKKIGQAN